MNKIKDLNLNVDLDDLYILKQELYRYYYFEVNGIKYKTMSEALNAVNQSELDNNEMKLLNDVDLDMQGYSDLPTIKKNLVFDLCGHTLITNNVFSRSREYGWGNRLFRIQNLENEPQPNVSVTIKNGHFISKIPTGIGRTGFLYTESTEEVNLENLTIDWNLENYGAGYNDRMCVIGYDGSKGATLTNVKCYVKGHAYQGCFEAQSYDEEPHPEYEFNLNNCEFTQECVDKNITPYNRQSRANTIVAGGQVTININGGRYIGDNTYGTIASFSSGANINIDGGAYVESKSSTSSTLGPVLLNELYGAVESKITVIDATIKQATGTGNTPMLNLYSQSGASAGMVSEFIINGGNFDDFGISTITSPAINRAIVNGGVFNKDITTFTNVQLGEGKTCTQDPTSGKWIVS